MKRLVTFLLICMLLTALAFPLTALADGPGVSMQITPAPAQLSEEGEVTFTFTVTNEGDVPLRDLEVILPNVWGTFNILDPWGSDGGQTILAPGETITRQLTHTVRAGEIGSRLPFVLNGYAIRVLLGADTGTAGDNDRVQTVSYVTITPAPAPTPVPAPTITPAPVRPIPDVTGYISFSRTVAVAGSTVDVSFKAKNTGNVPVQSVSVYLPEMTGKDAINNPFDLDVGKSKTISASVVIDRDVSVSPVIRFDYDGQTYSQTMESYDLHAADPDIAIVATVDDTTPPVGGSVGVKVTVVNSGTERLGDILVTDYMGNLLTATQSFLDAGASMTIDVAEMFSVPTELYYSVTADDESGDCVDAVSDVIYIDPVVPPEEVKLGLELTADPAQLTAPGTVTFSAAVTNGGGYELHAVSVSCEQLGVIGTIDSFSPGEKSTFKASMDIAASTEVSFTATALDTTGGSHTATALITVPLGAPTPSPEPQAAPGLPTLWIIIGAAVVVILVVTVIILATRNKKK